MNKTTKPAIIVLSALLLWMLSGFFQNNTNLSNNNSLKIYYDDSGNPYVQHVKIYNGEHYWSDKLNFNGKNTSQLIWDFVSQFNLDGTLN